MTPDESKINVKRAPIRRKTKQELGGKDESKSEILAKKKELQDRYRFKNLFSVDNVFSRLYISSAQEAKDLNLLEKHNIKYVLITAKDLSKRFPTKMKYGQV